jgi:hypothetical protein
MRARAAMLLGALAAVALLPAADASHWCDQTLIALAPLSASARETTFTVQVHNTGPDTITLTEVNVEFPWEGAFRNAGAGAVAAGQISFFTTVATPPTGAHTVEVRITGTSTGDAPGTAAVTCNTTFHVTVTASSPALDAPLLALAVGAAAVVVRRRP